MYAVKRQNTRSKKISLLQRSLLHPFMSLPRLEEEEGADDEDTITESSGRRSAVMDTPSADLPHSDRSVVFPEDIGETATETVLSNGSYSDDQQSVGKYIIPMRREAGETGLLSRSSGSSPGSSSPVSGSSDTSSDEGDRTPEPTRTRRKPRWMTSDDWMIGQQHTFFVDPDQVVYL